MEKFDLASRLLEFATKLPRHSTEIEKRAFLVNLAQPYKFTDDQDKYLFALNQVDWSACSDNFSVCVAVLKDDFDNAANIMRRIGAIGSIKRHEYIDWPVFRDFRKSPEFLAAYREVFGVEPTELLTHDTDQSVAAIGTPEPDAGQKLIGQDGNNAETADLN